MPLSHDQKCAMLPLYRQSQYHFDMAKIARSLRDAASENFHRNEGERLLRETMAAGGFIKPK